MALFNDSTSCNKKLTVGGSPVFLPLKELERSYPGKVQLQQDKDGKVEAAHIDISIALDVQESSGFEVKVEPARKNKNGGDPYRETKGSSFEVEIVDSPSANGSVSVDISGTVTFKKHRNKTALALMLTATALDNASESAPNDDESDTQPDGSDMDVSVAGAVATGLFADATSIPESEPAPESEPEPVSEPEAEPEPESAPMSDDSDEETVDHDDEDTEAPDDVENASDEESELIASQSTEHPETESSESSDPLSAGLDTVEDVEQDSTVGSEDNEDPTDDDEVMETENIDAQIEEAVDASTEINIEAESENEIQTDINDEEAAEAAAEEDLAVENEIEEEKTAEAETEAVTEDDTQTESDEEAEGEQTESETEAAAASDDAENETVSEEDAEPSLEGDATDLTRHIEEGGTAEFDEKHEKRHGSITDLIFKGEEVFVDSPPVVKKKQNELKPEKNKNGLIESIGFSGTVLVDEVSRKRKVIIKAYPAKKSVDEKGNVTYEKVNGKVHKIKVKEEPDEHDTILPNVAGKVEFKEPVPEDEAAIMFVAKTPKPVVWLALLATLLIAALILLLLYGPWGDPNAKKGYYDGKTDEEIQNDLNQQVDWYSMMMSVSSYVVLSPGSTYCPNLNAENVENNHCDQKFTFKLKETGEVLYQSGAISPGEYIDNVELTRSFEAGVYEGIVEFQGYEQDAKLFGGGQLWGHDEFGAPSSFEVLIIVTDDEGVAKATAKHYLE